MQAYEAALAKLEDIPVIVFSDDPAWCNDQSIFEEDLFNSKGNSTDCDLWMSLCKYHIIANSLIVGGVHGWKVKK